jgi:hypothetical protein
MFSEKENPFHNYTTTDERKPDSPTGVMDLNDCLQPCLVAPWTAEQEKAMLELEIMSMKPTNLHTSGMLGQRTTMETDAVTEIAEKVSKEEACIEAHTREMSLPKEFVDANEELDSSYFEADAEEQRTDADNTSVDHNETSHTKIKDAPIIGNDAMDEAKGHDEPALDDSLFDLSMDGESQAAAEVDAALLVGDVEANASNVVPAADGIVKEGDVTHGEEGVVQDSQVDTSTLTASARSIGGNSVQVSICSTSSNAVSDNQAAAENASSWSSIKDKIMIGFRSTGIFDTGMSARCSSADASPKNTAADNASPFDETHASSTVKDSFAFHSESEKSSKVELYIDHYGPRTFFRLMKDLKYNELITELHIFRSWNEDVTRSRNKADICILFDAIRTLPRLNKLELSNFLPAELDLVKGSQWVNPVMRSLRIHLCNGVFSKNLLKNVASIPALSELSLEVNKSFPFHHVLDSKSLQSLSLEGSGVRLEHAHVMELVYVLRKNDTLKRLSLEPSITSKSFKFMSYGLSSNHGLEDLRVNILPGTSLQTNEAIQEFAKALRHNTSLKSVWNTNYSELRISDSVSNKLFKNMSINNVLQEMLLFEEEPAFHCAKESLLKENRTSSAPILSEFYLPGCGAFESFGELALTTGNPKDVAVVESVVTDYAVIGSSIYRFADTLKDFGKALLGIAVDATYIMKQEKCGSMEDVDASFGASSIQDVVLN